MPGPSKSRRVEQCVFVEGGRRCRRSGTGDPAMCQPHKIVFMEAARDGARPRGARAVGDGLYNFLERWVSGEKITKKVAREAFEDARDIFSEVTAAGGFSGFVPPGARPNGTPNGHARTRVDPKVAAVAAARKRARIVLGFTPTEELTADLIKKKHRELARAHHPDRGGSTAKMQEINTAAEVLLEAI